MVLLITDAISFINIWYQSINQSNFINFQPIKWLIPWNKICILHIYNYGRLDQIIIIIMMWLLFLLWQTVYNKSIKFAYYIVHWVGAYTIWFRYVLYTHTHTHIIYTHTHIYIYTHTYYAYMYIPIIYTTEFKCLCLCIMVYQFKWASTPVYSNYYVVIDSKILHLINSVHSTIFITSLFKHCQTRIESHRSQIQYNQDKPIESRVGNVERKKRKKRQLWCFTMHEVKHYA